MSIRGNYVIKPLLRLRMKIHFDFGQATHQRHFTSIIEELARRGHELIKSASTKDCPGIVKLPVADGDHRSLMSFEAFLRDDDWGRLAYLVRTARDYLCYLRKEHADSLTIKDRIRNMLELGIPTMPAGIGSELATVLSALATEDLVADNLDRILVLVEAVIPAHPKIVEYLKVIDADMLCVTPYIVTQYGQTDMVKAARELGIPVVFMVGSWDNLTSKGAVQVMPDYTIVWNDIQREEAHRYHGIPVDSVRVVGAARFDEFWERRVEIGRAEYCRMLGLDPTLPIITYLGSSNLISGDERGFVRRWIDGLRNNRSTVLAEANVLLRPHPKFAKGWQESFTGLPRVGVALSDGPVVKALNNDAALFHCLAHSRAVVGANTSAELEAAILDKPVFTVEDEAFRTGQAGTIHFRYLAGSLAQVAGSLDEHYMQLAEELARIERPGCAKEFVCSFLRPGGIDRRACDTTADALEEIANKTQLTKLSGSKASVSAGGELPSSLAARAIRLFKK